VAEVAKVVIGIEGDTSKLKSDVAKATSDVNAAGAASADKATDATNKQAAATSALGDRLRSVKKTYGEQIEVVQGLIGKIAAVGAIATIFYKIGESISLYVIDRLKTANERAEEFRKTLSKTDEAAARLKIADKIDEVTEKLYQMEVQFRPLTNLIQDTVPQIGNLLGDNLKDTREQLRQLAIDAQTTTNRAELKKFLKEQIDADKAAAEARVNAAKTVADGIVAARRDAMTEEERIAYDAETRIAALVKAFNEQSNADRIAKEAETYEAIAAIADTARAQIEAKRKAVADEQARKIEDERRKEEEWWDKLRKHQEEQDERAKQTRESWTNAYRAIREESNRAFATDQAASMVQLAGQLRIEGMTAAANMNQIIVQGVG
jgi:hypothetical protein